MIDYKTTLKKKGSPDQLKGRILTELLKESMAKKTR